ncbi:MAG: hypothetical protein HC902_00925 [Calothrix sp. SM1_5_4]|nr:hypothetical protein [Calothrix sp. SM1_5_4]
MIKTSHFKAIGIAGLAALVLGGFQNCGGVDFASSNETTQKSQASEQPQPVDRSDNPTEQELTEDNKWLDANCLLPASAPASSAEDKTIQAHRGPLVIPSVRDLKLVNIRGPVLLPSGRNLDAENLRGPLWQASQSFSVCRPAWGRVHSRLRDS